VRLPLPSGLVKAAASASSLKIGVRPENVSLTALNATDIRLPAAVMLLEPLGSETLVTMKIGNTKWITRCAASFKEKPGHRLELFVPPDALRLFDAASGKGITA
jgi:ABC-type sugar transport system ATPase subunit